MLPEIQLSNGDKLETIRRLDQFRKWGSLDEKRYCLCCGALITGHDLVVVGGTRGTGPLRVICPTERCNSIPMDWALPTDEVLLQSSMRRNDQLPTRAGYNPDLRDRRAHSPLQWFAQQFKRSM